jgi:glucitol operon activator protein
MVSALITVAAIAWIAQLAFGGWQIRRFNREFDKLCQQGRVGVGRSAGRFKPRAIVAIAFDDHDRVSDTLLMRGPSSPARKNPRDKGQYREELRPDMIFPQDPLCQNALSLALKPKHV